MSEGHSLTGARRLVAPGLAALALLVGCATGPLYVTPQFALPEPAAEPAILVVKEAVDARSFTEASNRAPVPSAQGDAADADVTARIVGRRLSPTGVLGANIVLAPGDSVARYVGAAVIDGLRDAGVRAGGPESGMAETADQGISSLNVVVEQFWLNVRPVTATATIQYRFRVDISGDWPRFREGRTAEGQGSVSAGGYDINLWRRAFDRALEDIAKQVAATAAPGGVQPASK